MQRPHTLSYALATSEELVAEFGRSIRLTRAARQLSVDDLAKSSRASVSEIEAIEAGLGGDLLAAMRIAQALGFAGDLMQACKPPAASLDELERMEDLIRAEIEEQQPTVPKPPNS